MTCIIENTRSKKKRRNGKKRKEKKTVLNLKTVQPTDVYRFKKKLKTQLHMSAFCNIKLSN